MSTVSVLDVGPKRTVVLIAQKSPGDQWDVLGAGDSASAGILDGQIQHVGDLSESIFEAARKAQKAAGAKIERLYFNVDDDQMLSVRCKGRKILKGEGEITAADVRDACDNARRHSERFERFCLYAKELQFVIDQRDPVWNPLGVFGATLEVTLHLLEARANVIALWRRAVERAHFNDAVAVPSIWADCLALLAPAERERRNLVLNLSDDFFNFAIFEKARIVDYAVMPARWAGDGFIDEGAALALKKFFDANPGIDSIRAAGEAGQKTAFIERLSGLIGCEITAGQSWSGTGVFTDPRLLSAVGLLQVAEELDHRQPGLRRPKNLVDRLKQKTQTFIHEYF